MKILLISDIHGNDTALQAVLDKAAEAEKVICAGDLTGYFPQINPVIRLISSLDNCICTLGNHDYAMLNKNFSTGSRSADFAIGLQRSILSQESKSFLEKLPLYRKCRLEQKKFFIFHGSPDDYLNGRNKFWAESVLQDGIYIYGHSHIPFFESDPDRGWMVINPGSCGFPRDGSTEASFAILDTQNWHVDFDRIEYEIEDMVEKCKKFGLPDKFVKSLRAGKWLP